MRDSLKSTRRRWRTGWFWPLALLALPMCTNDFDALFPSFFQGSPPVTSAVMCDIPQVVPVEGGNVCADESEEAMGMSLAAAAVALNLGETADDPFVLDFSESAKAGCDGQPKKIFFHGPFPDGKTVCLNCGQQIPAVYANPSEVCVAVCKDLIKFGNGPVPLEGADAFCTANARVSTNFGTICFDNFCTNGGNPIPNPDDRRRNPELLTWGDFEPNNTVISAVGNTLSFEGPETPGEFSAGAASAQLITTGDAWVEFAAGETGVSHVVGLRTSCNNIGNCPDTDGTLGDIPLSLSLNVDGAVNIVSNVAGTVAVLAGPFEDYTAGERFRIHVVDHNDGTADISFFRYGTTPCVPNTPCNVPAFYTHPAGTGPSYPLRVDASFREAPASLANVTIMRIIE